MVAGAGAARGQPSWGLLAAALSVLSRDSRCGPLMGLVVGDGGDQEVHVEWRGGQTQALCGVEETGPGDRLYTVEEEEESRMALGFQREQCGQMCPHRAGEAEQSRL